MMIPIRERVLDAAITLLATGGLRALTHVRVDQRAGLPKGSTSNHFRTRSALLMGVTGWIVQRELPTVSVAFSPRSATEFVDAMCALLDVATRDNRDLTSARLVLFMEASHNAELREALSQGRASMGAVAISALTEMGARDPIAGAEAIAACFEGLILHRIARHAYTDPRPIFETVVRGALQEGRTP
ncbi:TetR family transcriptional regulator [Mycetocola sp. 2940]|uniref:TetR/AcrR family transcriptional regulator n=1 Tax=Mycetocola sp. 2940 TaxID=3156452 RepID=UPI0033919B25